ncbi:alpha/beta fold hydrolase [Luteolibacter sp. SL250]|uniref:alpha/beta fold hydrolase n=1 Tax=Luteolibacter sp. SL250 TaxID=2995170 RepID=UPI002271A34A|nr:alpha/beta fold hydrolase [Luteolibacter sp. SL250]WAC19840.1 alpha/beta fold hydrolase [Luteolibacter sp. SL250]
MIRYSKETDERREAGSHECWCLHGSVGAASDFRALAKALAQGGIGSRAVDLWRFLEPGPLPIGESGATLNEDAEGETFRGTGRSLLGYSMGGRLALHALLEKDHPWQAAVIVSAHPGLEDELERSARKAADSTWAAKAFAGDWKDFTSQWNAQPMLGGDIREPEATQRLVARRREISRSFLDWSVGAQEPLWERLSSISIPVLWVAGERDGKYTAIAERAAGLTPRGILAVAPEAGHRVPWENPSWFADRLSRFLKTAS